MNTKTLCFDKDDCLDREKFGRRLEQYLMIEHDFVDGSLVVSLEAPFGTGKTHFLSMWKTSLDAKRENDPTVPKVVLINAWESDYCGDPMMSIVSALINVTKSESPKKAAKIREAAKDIGWFVAGLANSVADQLTGLNPVEAGELAKAKRDERAPEKPDFVKLYEDRTKALENLKSTLREVYGGDSPNAFLLIDELDRCRPDYAVNYLETIKHVFDVHGLVFILSIDRGQLECSARRLFGEKLEFGDYFKKFAHRSLSIPSPQSHDLRRLAKHYTEKYVNIVGKRTSYLILDNRIEDVIEIITALKMRPRQIQEAFRIFGHAFSCRPENAGNLYAGLELGVIFVTCLKVTTHELCSVIVNANEEFVELGKRFRLLLASESARRWFELYLTGRVLRSPYDNLHTLASVVTTAGFSTIPTEQIEEELSRYNRAWGGGRLEIDRWQQIVQLIESADTFKK